MKWRIRHKRETVSTNLDAREGGPWEVFTADWQSAGRGRLDHRWLSPPGVNLMMSVVLPTGGRSAEEIATLPLTVGLSVATAWPIGAMLKWPNDVLVNGRKLAGILCERRGDEVIAGIGVNVLPQEFPSEIAARACFLGRGTVVEARDAVLDRLAALHARWLRDGFVAIYPELAARDYLRGREISVRQTDDDTSPLHGYCGGINPDGSLDVGGTAIYAGEAHVL